MRFNLRRCCKPIILKWLLPRLLSKKCCNRIPTSGEEVKRVNCYIIYLRSIGGELLHLVSNVDTGTNELYVDSLNPESETFSVQETIPLTSILTMQVTANHYYKGFSIHYGSIYDLFVRHVTKYDLVKINCIIIWNHLSQSRFNKKSLVSKDRIELLKFMLNNQLEQYDSQTYFPLPPADVWVSVFDLMTKIHTPRWIEHPFSEKQKQKLQMHLDSLVHSKDLKEDQYGYRYSVTSKALKTLEEYEKEERRHLDSVRIQTGLFWLTLIIALSAIVQAIYPYLFKQ